MISRSDDSELSKKLFIKRLAKQHKKVTRLGLEEPVFKKLKTNPYWAFRLFSARMMLGHYGDYAGWEHRAPWSENLWLNQPLGKPWDGTYTKKLYLLGEQGLGDEILFSQCIPDAIKALGHRNIVLDTDPRLIPVFERSFGITCVPRMGISADRPGLTAWMCLGDLLRLFRVGKWENTGPYLKPDPKRVKDFEWAKGKQAISWKGLKGGYPVEDFVRAVGPGIDVQYNESSDLLEPSGIDNREDVEGLLALFSNIDRLASVSNTNIHLGASLGCKVDLILAPPYSGKKYDQLQWRWGLHDTTTKWYSSVTIHRSLHAYVQLRHSRKASRMQSLGENAQLGTANVA